MRRKLNPSKKKQTKKKGKAESWAISDQSMLKRPVYIFGKPVARDIIFSNHRGVYLKKIEKRQRSLLVKIPFINSFLVEGELIMLITSGYASLTRIERFLLRYLTVFQRRALFIFTERRVLYVPTTFAYGYRHCIAEIRYADCKNIDINGRSLLFRFHNGQLRRFPYIGRKERRKLRQLASDFTSPENSKPKKSRTMTYLCAKCGTAVPDNLGSCSKCGLRFMIPATAGKMALLLPGGGYFYMHNTLYGVAGAVIELLMYVLLTMSALDMYHGFKGSVPAVILLSLALAGIKTISFHHVHDLVKGCFPTNWRFSSTKS